MVNRIIKRRLRRNGRKKKLVQEAIQATISENGIVVSRAITVKEICTVENYNRSIEMPICGTGKLEFT